MPKETQKGVNDPETLERMKAEPRETVESDKA